MEWIQILTILGTNTALFLWARTESRKDQEELRKISRDIETEMKDFHARMCVIEARKI